jgi:hypothetical protein
MGGITISCLRSLNSEVANAKEFAQNVQKLGLWPIIWSGTSRICKVSHELSNRLILFLFSPVNFLNCFFLYHAMVKYGSYGFFYRSLTIEYLPASAKTKLLKIEAFHIPFLL